MFDSGDGRQLWQRWTIEMAFNDGSGGGIQWRQKRLTAFGGVVDGLRQGDDEAKMVGTMRGGEGSARRGNSTTSQHNERTRGQHNKRTARDVGTTSWRDETMRGARRDNKTMRGSLVER